MKFGLWCLPSIDGAFVRCIDGEYSYVKECKCKDNKELFQFYLTAPAIGGERQKDIMAKVAHSGGLLTRTRAIAKMGYGVPDDIELYTVGERIRLHRLGLGLTQAQLAEKMGCAQKDISRWENQQEPKLSTLYKLAAALGCPVWELM